MKRIEAIGQIMNNVTNELVIATTGMISRELYAIKDRSENFYMLGSMGNALPIALGLALNINKKIIVLNGDAAALMSLGSLITTNHFKLKNLKHYILDNGSHGSTGLQPTCSDDIDFTKLGEVEVIKVDKEEGDAPRITIKPEEIKDRFINSIKKF